MPVYSDDTVIIPQGRSDDQSPFSIVVDPGDGDVQVQIRADGGAWFTPADPSYTLDAADRYELPRVNQPEVRLLPTGTAKFYVIGG